MAVDIVGDVRDRPGVCRQWQVSAAENSECDLQELDQGAMAGMTHSPTSSW